MAASACAEHIAEPCARTSGARARATIETRGEERRGESRDTGRGRGRGRVTWQRRQFRALGNERQCSHIRALLDFDRENFRKIMRRAEQRRRRRRNANKQGSRGSRVATRKLKASIPPHFLAARVHDARLDGENISNSTLQRVDC